MFGAAGHIDFSHKDWEAVEDWTAGGVDRILLHYLSSGNPGHILFQLSKKQETMPIIYPVKSHSNAVQEGALGIS